MQVYYEPISPQESERRNLCSDARYIGHMMLALEGAMFLLGILLQFIVRIFSLDEQSFLLVYAGVYAAGMTLPAIVVTAIQKRRFRPLVAHKQINPADAFFGILSAVGICMAANIIVNLLMLFFESVGIPEPQMPEYLQPTLSSLLLNLFVFAVLPALLEELVFRGYVLCALRAYGDWFAVVISSLLFGLMHGNITQMPFALIVGVALGWLYVMSENIWIPVAVHLINNGFSLLLQYLTIGIDETEQSSVTAFCIFALIVIGAICMTALLIRRSELLRRLPKKSGLSCGERVQTLLSSKGFLLCLAVFVLLTITDILGSIK